MSKSGQEETIEKTEKVKNEKKSETKEETTVDAEKKRKRQLASSTSSALDSSLASPEENKTQKKKKKKGGNRGSSDVQIKDKNSSEDSLSDHNLHNDVTKIFRQITEINNKISSMVSKEDGSLRVIIKEVFTQMKDELLKSVMHRIDILEGKLYDKESENTKLINEIEKLEKDLQQQKEESESLRNEMVTRENHFNEKYNRMEQYSRINNIRVDGISEDEEETIRETERKVVAELKANIPELQLSKEDIEIAHRVGKPKKDKPRQIIVKFFSRNKKADILSKKKKLKGTGMYVNEDLTHLNQLVLACVRKKQPDEVASGWTFNGNIFYKDMTDRVYKVLYKDYQDWLDLPWPKENEKNDEKK